MSVDELSATCEVRGCDGAAMTANLRGVMDVTVCSRCAGNLIDNYLINRAAVKHGETRGMLLEASRANRVATDSYCTSVRGVMEEMGKVWEGLTEGKE